MWETLELLLPERRASPKAGRPRVDDRAALNGILFVLFTGIPWEDLLASLARMAGQRRMGSVACNDVVAPSRIRCD
ncbi:transposase [Paraburkholderia sacchari]|uniref:Transposase n=1 Tax=Paraburkholderia sacchari TaxID=159450 RepID=A0A8T6ZGC7_9BURK|nr:transposase [Paraburkholderia sacchari]